MEETTATVVVHNWYSTCSNCGKGASPRDIRHDRILEYGPRNGEPGCGALFTKIAAGMFGEGFNEAVEAMRPDLEFVGLRFVP